MNQRIFMTVCVFLAAVFALLGYGRVNADEATNSVCALTGVAMTNAVATVCATLGEADSNALTCALAPSSQFSAAETNAIADVAPIRVVQVASVMMR